MDHVYAFMRSILVVEEDSCVALWLRENRVCFEDAFVCSFVVLDLEAGNNILWFFTAARTS